MYTCSHINQQCLQSSPSRQNNGWLAAFITEYGVHNAWYPAAYCAPIPYYLLLCTTGWMQPRVSTIHLRSRHAALHSAFSLDLLAPDIPHLSSGVQPVRGIWCHMHAHASCLCLARHPVEASACQAVHSCNLQRNIALRAGRLRKYVGYEVAFEALHRKLTPFPGERSVWASVVTKRFCTWEGKQGYPTRPFFDRSAIPPSKLV